MKMRSFWGMAFCCLIAVAGFSFTELSSGTLQDNWQLIAQRKVNFVRDKDEVSITTTQPLTGLRFAAKDRAIGISEVKVEFSNGDKLEPAIDEIIKKGEQSSIINLGEGKIVRKVSLKYRTIGSMLKGRADILVYGRTTSTESNE